MKKMQRILFLFSLLGLFGFNWPLSFLFSNPEPVLDKNSTVWLTHQMLVLKSQAGNINSKVLRLSLVAYIKAHRRGYAYNRSLLTVIDYSKPSHEKRMWVFDLKHGKALFNTWVSHGKNSGGDLATSFSNNHGSLKSSIGVFLTDKGPYMGGNGYSLRLRGLEQGINDNAYSRNVVIHGAWYATADTIRRYGQLGRSWGCPAVDAKLAKPLIDTIKSNTLVFVYYPDRYWLRNSRFLTS